MIFMACDTPSHDANLTRPPLFVRECMSKGLASETSYCRGQTVSSRPLLLFLEALPEITRNRFTLEREGAPG